MIIIIAEPGKKVHLGRIGENEARAVQFDISQTQAEFPGASFSVLNMRPQDPDAYPVNGQFVRIEGSNLYWTLQSGDLTEDGLGECELKATVDGVIVKSEIWTTEICPALDGNGTPPEPWESWQQQVEDDADRAEAAAEDSEAWAIGERGGEPVAEGDETYHNNAKYWANQAEETLASKADKTDTVLNTTLSRGRKANTTVGQGSFAFGYDVEASGAASHAEGYGTKASGTWSHAEGDETEASGQASHAEGYQTKAKGSNQHVSGVMNVEDNNNTFAEIVGNGFRAGSSIKRANARALDWNGNEYLKGDLYVQCDKNSQNGSKVAKVSDIPDPVDISGKADKVAGAVAGHFAGLDAEGNLTDSGSKASDFLTEHQDISGKADKVSGAVSGNFAGLDENGNLTDSGSKAADFVPVTSFRADAMPMSATDPKTVAQTTTELKSQIDGKASIIHDTVSNVAIASVPDAAANLPLTALRFAVKPIQAGSGDPYPAGGSPQRWDEVWESGTYNTSGAKANDDTRIRTKNAIAVQAETSYYFKSPATLGLRWYDSENNCITSANTTAKNEVITSPANAAYLRFSVVGVTSYGNDISVNYPSSDHDYHKWANNRPITGRTSAVVAVSGANILNAVSSNSLNYGGNYTNFTIDDTTGKVTITNGASMGFIVHVFPGHEYTFSYVKSSNEGINTRIREYSALPTSWTDNFIEQSVNESNGVSGRVSKSFTVGENTKYIICCIYHGSSATNLVISEWMCEPGGTAHAYERYTSYSQHTVQFGSTVYGATIDWVNGLMVVDHALATLGKADVFSVVQASTGIWYARFYILTGCTFSTVSGKTNEVKSNMYTTTFGASTDNAVRLINGYPYVYNSQLDTLAKAEEFYLNNPLQIWYPLDTPVTIPLSDLDEIRTVEGQNNVWADCGDVLELTYGCDTKGYIDKKFTELQALILEN